MAIAPTRLSTTATATISWGRSSGGGAVPHAAARTLSAMGAVGAEHCFVDLHAEPGRRRDLNTPLAKTEWIAHNKLSAKWILSHIQFEQWRVVTGQSARLRQQRSNMQGCPEHDRAPPTMRNTSHGPEIGHLTNEQALGNAAADADIRL